VLSLAPFALGCVERRLLIRSEPEGAKVLLDNEPRGVTPVEIPFSYYGARDVVLEKEGFVTLHAVIDVDEPIYQIFPADFVTDVLLPVTIRDARDFSFRLEPLPERPMGAGDVSPVIERARELRDRARAEDDGAGGG